MRVSILFGGAAGQGPNILTNVLGEALVNLGYHVFYSRDYQSLIRGGHNFNVLTFSDEPVYSNDSTVDLVVALDERTVLEHKKELKKNGFIVSGKHPNMYYAGKVFRILGLEFEVLDKQLKKLKRKYDENLEQSKEGYDEKTQDKIEIPKSPKIKGRFMDGNDGISEGAVKSGLDVYYAYPMTPSTSVLGKLASKQNERNYLVLELENEIAVINATIGSAITGAKAMCGSSGGGIDLMSESLSLCGVAGIPIVIFLAQRPGPGTGVATYTSQGDLNMVRHAGHGEFNRMVLAPGCPVDAIELTNEAFYFSQKYKIPVIVISDKHLGESFYTMLREPKLKNVPRLTEMGRYNSYEKDENGCATEDATKIKKNILERLKIKEKIAKEAEDFEMYSVFGNPKSENVIVSWGSTKGAIYDAILGNKDVKYILIKYIEPFPKDIAKELKDKNVVLVENNSTAILSQIIAEKTGIIIPENKKILRFDGRPFLSDELKKELEEKFK